jgi:hypothetical protein
MTGGPCLAPVDNRFHVRAPNREHNGVQNGIELRAAAPSTARIRFPIDNERSDAAPSSAGGNALDGRGGLGFGGFFTEMSFSTAC